MLKRYLFIVRENLSLKAHRYITSILIPRISYYTDTLCVRVFSWRQVISCQVTSDRTRMDVLNKLRNTVSNTISNTVQNTAYGLSQLSSVLPGNPVTREFEATAHVASAGSGLLWKIYSGYKKSTKQEAAIFVFEKRMLERWPAKADRELVLETLKRGVTQLTKLRHPQVLTVQHPLEESRDSLAFATEPVFASLANVLGRQIFPRVIIKEIKLYCIETDILF